MNKIKVYNT